MIKLILGLALWSITHFIPAMAVGLRKNLVSRLGENPYKGLFALLVIIALYLIVSGWKSVAPVVIFTPPDWGSYAARLLVLLGFILFLAPYAPNNFRRMFRHPQLMGVACWGVGHLLANGEARSIVLFGGLALWAVIEILLLNRRDGEWAKPERVTWARNLGLVIIGAVAYLAFLYMHHRLIGSAPLI